jgi:hypothetical protein
MEQHPIPRQITTFEFKLIGFMTLKQFIYLIIFLPIAYVVLSMFPIPILNFLLAAMVAFVGIALAFIPINDRPLDVYIKNFVKRVVTPTQFYYQKTGAYQKPQSYNQPASQSQIKAQVEANQKLTQYINQTKNTQSATSLNQTTRIAEVQTALDLPIPVQPVQPQTIKKKEDTQQAQSLKQPFLKGVVKNRKQVPLPGILIYINDQNNNPLRLMKTNTAGNFESYNSLPEGVYDVEIKDPNGKHMFDKIKLNLKNQNLQVFEFFSKELI